MHADRANRAALTLLGLLVLAAGTAAMTASAGVFGTGFSRHTLLANRVSTYTGQHGTWVWPAAAGACLLIALAALRWILVLLTSTDRAGDIPIPIKTPEGTTILQPAALTGALTREIGTYHGVDTARSRITGHASTPQIILAVTASPSADLHALHHRIETQALAHARHAIGHTDLAIQLDLGASRKST